MKLISKLFNGKIVILLPEKVKFEEINKLCIAYNKPLAIKTV